MIALLLTAWAGTASGSSGSSSAAAPADTASCRPGEVLATLPVALAEDVAPNAQIFVIWEGGCGVDSQSVTLDDVDAGMRIEGGFPMREERFGNDLMVVYELPLAPDTTYLFRGVGESPFELPFRTGSASAVEDPPSPPELAMDVLLTVESQRGLSSTVDITVQADDGLIVQLWPDALARDARVYVSDGSPRTFEVALTAQGDQACATAFTLSPADLSSSVVERCETVMGPEASDDDDDDNAEPYDPKGCGCALAPSPWAGALLAPLALYSRRRSPSRATR